MNWKQLPLRLLQAFFAPIKGNAAFFVFMYALGVLSAVITLPRKHQLYDNLFLELFLDLYVASLVLLAIPRKVRFWIRGVLYIIIYSIALADAYCFINFGSTLNPSMLMLVGETNSNEAGNFIASCLSPDVIFSPLGFILLVALLQIAVAVFGKRWKHRPQLQFDLTPWLGLACAVLLIVSLFTSWHNKAATHKLMTGKTIGEVEHTLTEKGHAVLYTPVNRLMFSIYANQLAAHQVTQLIEAADKVKVDSCTYRSPNIVLIIGESFGRHHSQQYGYFMETTPRQKRLEQRRLLTKFTDVVTCWNLTSFVFKNMFSTHVVGEKGEWCDYPLFPEVFRKAGYHVTFITNEFLPKAAEAVYDFSGGFFLNDPKLSALQFDARNSELHPYDDGLLKDYDDSLKNLRGKYNLTIFHLMGQHVDYKQRYPRNRAHFWASSYEKHRPELNNRQRKTLSHYDNATLYNDSIVYQIVKRFSKENAIVIYVPDHGEECYEGTRGFICRNHSAAIDWPLAHYEFEVPFWIYCSHEYIRQHRDIYRQIRSARDKRYMTDALPHLLLYLAGIHTPTYNAKYNILSPDYDEMRPRILKNTTDYDKLRSDEKRKEERGERRENSRSAAEGK